MISNELLKKKILDEAIHGRLVENDLTLPSINVKQSIYNKNISVPKNWVITTIGLSGLEFTNGNYSSQYPKAEEFVDYGIPFIRANNLQNDTIVSSGMYYITPEKHEYLSKGHLKTNDIIVAIRGSIGLCSIVPQEYDNANLNAQLTVLRSTTNNINPKFLLYEIKSNFIQKQFEQYITGSALKQLSEKNMRKCFLVLPPIKEQERIVKKTEELFELIDKKDKNDKEKEKLKTLLKEKILDSAIRGQLVENDLSLPTVDVEGINDNVPFDIPSNWVWKRMSDCYVFKQGVQIDIDKQSFIKNETTPLQFLRIVDFTQNNSDIRYVSNEYNSYILNKNELAIVRYGASAGFICLGKSGVLANNLFKLIPQITIDVNYMFNFLNSSYFQSKVRTHSVAMPSLKFASLNKILLAIPPLEQQKKIVDKIEKCFELIEQL